MTTRETTDYRIYKMKEGDVYIIILSKDVDAPYWESMKHDISILADEDSYVRFDFIYRNGLRNRFFRAKLSGRILMPNTLKKYVAGLEEREISRVFFDNNRPILESSVLSSRQREKFLR